MINKFVRLGIGLLVIGIVLFVLFFRYHPRTQRQQPKEEMVVTQKAASSQTEKQEKSFPVSDTVNATFTGK